MNDDESTIMCPRCGEEMKANARYCMKCGNLNYSHPDNNSMLQYETPQESYVVGGGKRINSNRHDDTIALSIGSNMGSRKFSFILNLGLYILSVLGIFLVSFNTVGSIDKIPGSNFPLLLVIVSISFLFCYAFQNLYTKMNLRWWAVLIPFYNMFELCGALLRKKMLFILLLIPGVNVIFSIYLAIVLSKKFKISPLLTIVFPIFVIPYLAFGSSAFDGRLFVDNGETTYEKQYKRNKIFVTINILLIVVGVGLFAYSFLSSSDNIGGIYYKNVSNRIVDKVKKNISSGKVTCWEVDFNEGSGTYYFYFNSFYDVIYIPAFMDDISGYVKVEYVNGEPIYSVSLTDGKTGVKETRIDLIEDGSFGPYTEVDNSYSNGIMCDIDL